MNLKRSLLYSLPVIAILSGGSAAFAAPITVDSVGDSFTVNFSGVGDSGSGPVSVEEKWKVTALTGNSITFELTLDNTSPTASRLTGFAFDTDPNATNGSSSSSIYQHVFFSSAFDVCVENDSNSNCNGNHGNIGLQPADAAHTFNLTLNFAEIGEEGVTLSNFFARLQAVGADGTSAKLTGEPTCTSCDEDEDPTPDTDSVPEPVSALLLTTAAGAFGLRRRARSSATAE